MKFLSLKILVKKACSPFSFVGTPVQCTGLPQQLHLYRFTSASTPAQVYLNKYTCTGLPQQVHLYRFTGTSTPVQVYRDNYVPGLLIDEHKKTTLVGRLRYKHSTLILKAVLRCV
uniref:Uncharacterized protein n=1 Tax=Cacopsylla melanoneura TaxID=428564 RepID=A0A8D9BMI4_9HEMI